MRNLRIVQDAVESIVSHSALTSTAWDTENDSLLFTLGPSASRQTIELRRALSSKHEPYQESSLIAAWDAPSPLPDQTVDKVLDLHYFAENGTACLVLAGGDIVRVREEPLEGQPKIEIIGSVDEGISAAAWSPDEELLTIATRVDTFLFMTIDFDYVASVTLSDDDAKLSRHVSVGWGKSETQFKGKRAKALRDPTMPEKVDVGVLSSFDQQEVTISWRGDGSFVALNSITGDGPRRIIRIFSREGALDSVTEPVNGLEGALSWRPSGNLIAAVQRYEEKANIVFFERNGLTHGSFPLRSNSPLDQQWKSPISLAWNNASSVLAVSFSDKVQLWTMGNYHYYLKQELLCASAGLDTPALPVLWHPEEPLRMSIFASQKTASQTNGTHEELERSNMISSALRAFRFTSTVSSGPLNPPNDLGIVAVIDGRTLKITPLRKANVPPPMALHEIEVECVKDVAVNSSNSYIATLHEDSFSVIKTDTAAISTKPAVEKVVKIRKLETQIAQQICFRDEKDILILLKDLSTQTAHIYDNTRDVTYEIPTTTDNLSLNPSSTWNSVHMLDGSSVFELHLSPTPTVEVPHQTLPRTPSCRFPSTSPILKFDVLHYNSSAIALGLTANGALYANERQLVKNCTSFLVTQSHIIITTANHLLKFIHIANVPDLEIPPDDPEVDERCRNIERGARLVTVIPTTFSLVLQMPRGNLETIYPRALVLASIRRNIAAREYGRAFLTCRSQRVDMNILHDYDPKQFLANVGLVVDQLKKVEHIDLLLSQLREEDVSTTMYRQTLPSSNGEADAGQSNEVHARAKSGARVDATSKVNDICDAFLAALQDRFSTNLQNVITAHVCKVPPNIEQGLLVIASLRGKDAELTERATEHICFLADVNRVYDAALGLYDLDLALGVAQQSQKDPREYLPYLQSLQNVSLLRRQFTIDHDLGRHAKALAHLRAMGSFDEVQGYTEKHELYKQGLALYRYEPEALKVLTKLYADFLSSKSKFKDAAIGERPNFLLTHLETFAKPLVAYESLGEYKSASDAYSAANLWQECLSSASLVPLSPEELRSLAKSVAENLLSTKDYHACAIVNLNYLMDLPAALSNFCKAYEFSTAIRLAGQHRQPELLGQVVDPGVIEASATLTELLADCKAQMNAQVPRLRELRILKAANPLGFLTGDAADGANTGAEIPDDISLAPSTTSTTGGASLFTRYTQRSGLTNTVATGTSRKTSKNRRREERKRARGKKGSVYEEEYLVNSIGRLIERVNDTASDVQSTVECLLRRNMRERARAVEEAMVEVVGICKDSVDEVFETVAKASAGHATDEQGLVSTSTRPPGAEGVLWDSLEESKATRTVPVVKPYELSDMWA